MPVLIFIVLVCACLLAGCGKGSGHYSDDDRPKVLATTTMIEDLARVIGGDEVEVVGLMRTGEDPHLYDVKPKDATTIKNADLVLMNGLHLEATLADIIEHQAGGKVVALAEHPDIQPITGKEGLEVAADPHCWMDVNFYRVYVQQAVKALVNIAPEHKTLFQQRAVDYMNQLEQLDTWVRERFSEVPEQQRVIVTGHDAFAYFGRAYGIEVHGLIGISTEQEPKPQDIEALKKLIKDNNIRAVFPESSLSGSLIQLLNKVANDSGAVVGKELHSDSLGAPGSGADTYIGMIRHNTNTMVDALKGE